MHIHTHIYYYIYLCGSGSVQLLEAEEEGVEVAEELRDAHELHVGLGQVALDLCRQHWFGGKLRVVCVGGGGKYGGRFVF